MNKKLIRKYEPIWRALKDSNSYIIINCPDYMRSRIRRSVSKEKLQDENFRDYDSRKLFFHDIKDGIFMELNYYLPTQWIMNRHMYEPYELGLRSKSHHNQRGTTNES